MGFCKVNFFYKAAKIYLSKGCFDDKIEPWTSNSAKNRMSVLICQQQF